MTRQKMLETVVKINGDDNSWNRWFFERYCNWNITDKQLKKDFHTAIFRGLVKRICVSIFCWLLGIAIKNGKCKLKNEN